MIRLGLCCLFYRENIHFRTVTAAKLSRLDRAEAGKHLSEICLQNAGSLFHALRYCAEHGIGDFRISSDLLPLSTHPVYGYSPADLPSGRKIRQALNECGEYARSGNIRTTMHPDQFVVLNSPRREVVESSRRELLHHARLAGITGVDVITIHGGGGYGDKISALARLAAEILRLPGTVRQYLALENDDRVFTPFDLMPVCRAAGLPLVYDVHHHRCLPDVMHVEEASLMACNTWNREPVFHVSSPLNGWGQPGAGRHSDYIDPSDFPSEWKNMSVTVEVEAKAKELAVDRLRRDLVSADYSIFPAINPAQAL